MFIRIVWKQARSAIPSLRSPYRPISMRHPPFDDLCIPRHDLDKMTRGLFDKQD